MARVDDEEEKAWKSVVEYVAMSGGTGVSESESVSAPESELLLLEISLCRTIQSSMEDSLENTCASRADMFSSEMVMVRWRMDAERKMLKRYAGL